MPRVKVPVPHEPSTEVVEASAQINHQPMAAPQTPSSKRFSKQQLVFAAAGVVFFVLILMLLNVMSDRNQLQTKVEKLSTNTAAGSSDEVKKLTAQIGAVFQLPTGETPTLATVSDASKVKDQAFFANAQNGDKVLLYSKAGQAILYRPSTKKIISVAPVDLNGPDATSTTDSPTSR